MVLCLSLYVKSVTIVEKRFNPKKDLQPLKVTNRKHALYLDKNRDAFSTTLCIFYVQNNCVSNTIEMCDNPRLTAFYNPYSVFVANHRNSQNVLYKVS